MPQFQSFTLADGQATPVTKTFSPVSLVENEARWADRSAGISAQQSKISSKVVGTNSVNGMNRITEVIEVPLYDAVSGKQVNIAKVVIQGYIPNTTTQAQRDDLYAYLKNFVAATPTKDRFTKVEGNW